MENMTVNFADNPLSAVTDLLVWLVVRHNTTPFISIPVDADMIPRFDPVREPIRADVLC